MAGYVPYMMNSNNYNMTPYQNQIMQQNTHNFDNQQYYGAYNNMNNFNNGFNSNNFNNNFNNQGIKVDFSGVFVSTYEDVKRYPVPVDNAVLLMDKEKNRFYIKMLDNTGNPVISTYKFEEVVLQDTTESTEDIENTDKDTINKSLIELNTRLNTIENKINTYEDLFDLKDINNKQSK